MTKTAAEWVDSLSENWEPSGRAAWVALVQAIIDDARAGMVPEAELDLIETLKRDRARAIEHLAEYISSNTALRAELARAWEALEALVSVFDDVEVLDTPELAMREIKLTLDSAVLWNAKAALKARALQPPGGKAK